jgi:hypothetical protein
MPIPWFSKCTAQKRRPSLLPFALVAAFLTPWAKADSFWSQLFDTKDGQFDVSSLLASKRGFLPVPILITEPAVGYGGGLAAVFFHESAEAAEKRRAAFESGEEDISNLLPPSTSVVLGAATENGSWLAGGGHQGIWKDDRIRYLGAAGYASINLKFHGIGDDTPLDDSPEHYNIEGLFILQDIKFRLWDTDFFAGGRYQYLGANVDFDDVEAPPGVRKETLDSTVSQLGLVLGYDSRDNIFSPNRGIKADLQAMFAGEPIGSDDTFQKYRLASLFFWQWGRKLDLGLRLDGRLARGDTPFFELPFITLRGIPAMRYQDNVAAVTELQLNYRVDPRWSLVGFGGLGQAADKISDLGSEETRETIGGGFRYLIARRLGLRAGIDVARGPEEWAFYVQIGNAWLM